jgi:hypothetical protein
MMISVITLSSFAQFILVDLNDTTGMIEIDTSNPYNIWQIGKPQKAFLNSGYNDSLAIITDTANVYPSNNVSSFIFRYPKDILDNYSGGLGGHLAVRFESKFQTDSLNDYGYIEISADSGLTWNFITNQYTDTSFLVYFPGWGTFTNGTSGWAIRRWGNVNSEIGIYTGNSSDWENTDIAIMICSIAHPKRDTSIIGCYPKSLWLKFNFVSDSVQANAEGWLIDDLRYGVEHYVGIGNNFLGNISIYPNPTNSNFTVTLPIATEQITITNTLGQVMQTQTINKGATHYDVSLAESGTYFIHVTTAGATVTKKVIVIR